MLADGKIAGAELKDGVWSIPIESLAGAGLLDEKPKEKPKEVEGVADDSQPLTWKERALVAEAEVKQLEKTLAQAQDTRQIMTELLARLSSRPMVEATEQDKRRGWFGRK